MIAPADHVRVVGCAHGAECWCRPHEMRDCVYHDEPAPAGMLRCEKVLILSLAANFILSIWLALA